MADKLDFRNYKYKPDSFGYTGGTVKPYSMDQALLDLGPTSQKLQSINKYVTPAGLDVNMPIGNQSPNPYVTSATTPTTTFKPGELNNISTTLENQYSPGFDYTTNITQPDTTFGIKNSTWSGLNAGIGTGLNVANAVTGYLGYQEQKDQNEYMRGLYDEQRAQARDEIARIKKLRSDTQSNYFRDTSKTPGTAAGLN